MARLRFLPLAILLTVGADASAAPSFTGIGFLPGGTASYAFGVSGDGQVVVGASDGSEGRAIRWTRTGGVESLGALPTRPPGGDATSGATAVSADGSVVVGTGDNRAFRWTAPTGIVALDESAPTDFLENYANGVSADGSVVVGTLAVSGTEAFRWTAAAGFEGLSDLIGGGVGGNGFPNSRAQGVSADGLVIVGRSLSDALPQGEAFRWTSATGMVGLGALTGGIPSSYANATSADGSVVVGGS
jgi:probable HAF family extracellular repeat protein